MLNYTFALFNFNESRKCSHKVELNVNIVERVLGKNYRGIFTDHLPDLTPGGLSWNNQNTESFRTALMYEYAYTCFWMYRSQ
jgi:hypothetical protein